MTTLIQSLRSHGSISLNPIRLPAVSAIGKRTLTVAAMIGLIALTPGGWALAADALSDAYLAVAVFVAGTLTLVFAAERAFKTDLGQWLQRYRRWQVPAAALLGAFPGCGGAIIAVTQYTRGYLSFGGVVATLTATMGDAMFLLLASEPTTAFGVLIMGVVVGVITGYAIDAIHGQDYLRPTTKTETRRSTATQAVASPLRLSDRLWLAFMVPGLIIGVLAAFQVDVDAWLGSLDMAPVAQILGVTGALLVVAMWLRSGNDPDVACAGNDQCSTQQASVTRSVIDTTNFVTTWVVFAFVGYEMLVNLSGADLGKSLAVWGPLVPAMAILIGFVPGCGPQIMVTSMYLSGAVPLSAQLGNAIANDGDALFPALAVAPKAALMATLYSAIPAVIVAYGWYVLMEI